MHKAYDIMLQSEVSAFLAAKNGGFEPYRYECSCCGEEVYIAAAHSKNMVPHFKHRNGNNNVQCENYLGRFNAISIDSRSRKSNQERVEFYFNKGNKTFCLGLRFSDNEINTYEQNNVVFEIRAAETERAFSTLSINNRNFAPDVSTPIPLNKFAFRYFLSNTLNRTKRPYDFFKAGNVPTFFKLIGQDVDYRAKLVRGVALYTNVPYFVAFQSQSSRVQDVYFPNEISVDEAFRFETMSRTFLGKVIVITNKTPRIEALVKSWGYRLEASETLTLLWPPASVLDGISNIPSDHVFLYSSFELQAHGNINIHSGDIDRITNGITRITINPKTKVFINKKNAEIIIDKCDHKSPFAFERIPQTESCANTYTVPEDGEYFLFNRSGVKHLSKGQSVILTSHCEIKGYYYSYLINHIYRDQQNKLTGELLLIDILAHSKREEVFDKDIFSSRLLSNVASQYVEKCEAVGLINSVARRYIEEERL